MIKWKQKGCLLSSFIDLVSRNSLYIFWFQSIKINARERRKERWSDLQVYIPVTWFIFVTKLPWLLYAAWKGNDSSIISTFLFPPILFKRWNTEYSSSYFFYWNSLFWYHPLFLSLQKLSQSLSMTFSLIHLFAYCFHTQTFTVTRRQLNQKNTVENCLALAYRKKKGCFFISRLFMVYAAVLRRYIKKKKKKTQKTRMEWRLFTRVFWNEKEWLFL